MNKTKKIIILFVVVLVLICIKNVQQGRILKEKICILDSLSEYNAFIKDALMLQISLYANRNIISNLGDILSDSVDIASPISLFGNDVSIMYRHRYGFFIELYSKHKEKKSFNTSIKGK